MHGAPQASPALSCQACNVADYFHHGGGQSGIPERHNYLCDNIKVDGYLEITTPSAGCTLVTGLREGVGSDNPATWDDVVVEADGEFTCEDYDVCPSSGVSGFARGPGDGVVRHGWQRGGRPLPLQHRHQSVAAREADALHDAQVRVLYVPGRDEQL